MTFVVDASVTLSWCFKDETSDFTKRVLLALDSDDVIVPGIWALEVANALVVAERRQRISVDEMAAARRMLNDLPIRVVSLPGEAEIEPLIRIARASGLSAYDACYAELALQEGLALATADRRLRGAAQQVGIPLFT